MSLIRNHRLLGVAVSLVIAACAPDAPDNALRVSGHVEATEVHVSSEVGGRLLELRVDEGDRVKSGDVLAKVDPTPIHVAASPLRASAVIAPACLADAQRALYAAFVAT